MTRPLAPAYCQLPSVRQHTSVQAKNEKSAAATDRVLYREALTYLECGLRGSGGPWAFRIPQAMHRTAVPGAVPRAYADQQSATRTASVTNESPYFCHCFVEVQTKSGPRARGRLHSPGSALAYAIAQQPPSPERSEHASPAGSTPLTLGDIATSSSGGQSPTSHDFRGRPAPAPG
eukprot:CAMPEP_0174359360 /NCGR_PEP_ID=MMETSP0811_2-20130205/48251_1 /TAXON_ID=73025 ORGANISM="Eutreptiella gymnastica-like, Strain CCMP1594" /NCGR_SAMPLE_ID=MMETSP0811_2 /ASSEMBLY_ACC=CAM_ASM_000667 /LENGTH=175 /DNA_ID=CAMNT_0015494029 /DNA_START=541 /DNA_END=1066 /DNA_ORIENTATION=-